jgi:small subunit ribosomal protein S15
MALSTATKQQIINDNKQADGDTGSPEVQVALLTQRINDMAAHMRSNEHDYHSRRGLLMMVGRRNRLLKYLMKTDRQRYLALIKRLGLRK